MCFHIYLEKLSPALSVSKTTWTLTSCWCAAAECCAQLPVPEAAAAGDTCSEDSGLISLGSDKSGSGCQLCGFLWQVSIFLLCLHWYHHHTAGWMMPMIPLPKHQYLWKQGTNVDSFDLTVIAFSILTNLCWNRNLFGYCYTIFCSMLSKNGLACGFKLLKALFLLCLVHISMVTGARPRVGKYFTQGATWEIWISSGG